MLDKAAPEGIKPVKVAALMTMDCVTTKSSAVSLWMLPGLEGVESVAIFPSGAPVEKEKVAAEAWAAVWRKTSAIAAVVFVDSTAHTNCSSRPRIDSLFTIFVMFLSVMDFIRMRILSEKQFCVSLRVFCRRSARRWQTHCRAQVHQLLVCR